VEVLLTIDALQARIGFRRSWIYNQLAAGNFPEPIKIGRSVRWREVDIDAWITAHAQATEQSQTSETEAA